jgi:hypothetical protein
MAERPDIALVGPARRDLYKRHLYNHKGVQMVDLFHASRDASLVVILVLYPIWEAGIFVPVH